MARGASSSFGASSLPACGASSSCARRFEPAKIKRPLRGKLESGQTRTPRRHFERDRPRLYIYIPIHPHNPQYFVQPIA